MTTIAMFIKSLIVENAASVFILVMKADTIGRI